MKIRKWHTLRSRILRERRERNLKLWLKSVGLVGSVYLYILLFAFGIIGHLPDKYTTSILVVLFVGFVITTKHDLFPGPA